MSLEVIFFDMDGVLCDFQTHARFYHSLPEDYLQWPLGKFDPQAAWRMKDHEFWKPIDDCGEEFWATIPMYPWARDMWDTIATSHLGTDIRVLTSPTHHQTSLSGKIIWMNRFLGWNASSSVTISEEKKWLAAPGRILIDDLDRNIVAWQKQGGLGLLIPQVWNSDHKFIPEFLDDPVEYVRLGIEGLLS